MSTGSGKDKTRTVDLGGYRVTGYSPGAGPLRRGLWYVVAALVFASPLVPFYAPKRWLLRLFGAKLGRGAVIKPGARIKYPWRLRVGDDCWIGEGAWIDNLAEVRLGNNVCISQEAYLLTGNHDYKSPRFDLVTGPVRIEDGAWVGARAVVCPGLTVGRNAVLSVGAVLTRDAQPDGVYAGNPATRVRERRIEPDTA